MIKNEEFWSIITNLVKTSKICIDRAKNTSHPRYPDRIYPVDYGYIINTASMDGDGIDVWIRSDETKNVDAIMCIIDSVKRDSEIKILVGCTEDEKEEIYRFHNNTNGMKGIMIRR